MFNWLIRLFRRPIRQIEIKAINRYDEQQSTKLTLANTDVVHMPIPTSPYDHLKCTLFDAFKEFNEENSKREQELLNDEKLTDYFKAAFKCLVGKTPLSSGNILFGYEDIKINFNSWQAFTHIFKGVCKELNIEASTPCGDRAGDYIFVSHKSLMKAVEKFNCSFIDVDDRIRSFLYKGPYR